MRSSLLPTGRLLISPTMAAGVQHDYRGGPGWQKALPAIDLGPLRGPHGLVFVGGKLWFTAEGAKVIGSYDPATNKIDWVLGTGQNRTHMIFVADDLKWIVTSNVASATMTFIDKTTARPGGPGPVRVDPAAGTGRWPRRPAAGWADGSSARRLERDCCSGGPRR